MITIIHGDDIVSSRSYFLEQKEKANNPLTLDGKTLTITDLAQAIDGTLLFSQEKTIFIEDFFVRKKSKEQEAILSYLRTQKRQNVFLWDGKELTKAEVSLFPKSTVKHFPLPKTIFAFLDGIKPNDPAQNMKRFHSTLATLEPELVFFLLVRRIRLLLALADPHDQDSAIEEEKRLAPWQQTRLRSQLRLFTKEKLLQMHKDVFAIDLAQKTGTTPLTLTQALDLFLLDL